MLVDQFAECMAYKDLWSLMPPGMRAGIMALGERVKKANRFTLDRSATMMIQNLSTMPNKSFLNAMTICRLPFPTMWVEFDFKDRADWLKEAAARGLPMSYEAASEEPSRMGLYLEEYQNGDERYIAVHPCWSHVAPGVEVAREAFAIDLGEAAETTDYVTQRKLEMQDPAKRAAAGYRTLEEAETWAELAGRITYFKPEYMDLLWKEYEAQGPLVVARAKQLSAYDLAAEWRFTLALLTVLNSRNMIALGEAEDVSKLNKAREKRGKTPILPQRPIKLALSKVQKNRMARGYVDRRNPAEAHWVMGHFKRKPSGLYWWSPHTRAGDPDKPREYSVTA